MADREFIVTFEGDRARIRLGPVARLKVTQTGGLPARFEPHYILTPLATLEPSGLPEYHVFAPSARRAEQIARVMRGNK